MTNTHYISIQKRILRCLPATIEKLSRMKSLKTTEKTTLQYALRILIERGKIYERIGVYRIK